MSKYSEVSIFITKAEIIHPTEVFGKNARRLLVLNDQFATETRFIDQTAYTPQVGDTVKLVTSKQNALGHTCFINEHTKVLAS